jgi:hypothetical protein
MSTVAAAMLPLSILMIRFVMNIIPKKILTTVLL